MSEIIATEQNAGVLKTYEQLASEPPVVGSATGSAARSEAENEPTPMEDALLMLELWNEAIRAHIQVKPRSPIHRLVKQTIERLKQPNVKLCGGAPNDTKP